MNPESAEDERRATAPSKHTRGPGLNSPQMRLLAPLSKHFSSLIKMSMKKMLEVKEAVGVDPFVLQLDGDEGLILDQDAEVVHKEDIMPELTESHTVGTEEDITVLEENAVLSPVPDLSAPESGSESLSSTKTCTKCIAACALQDGQWRSTCVSFLFFRLRGGGSVAGGHCTDSCC